MKVACVELPVTDDPDVVLRSDTPPLGLLSLAALLEASHVEAGLLPFAGADAAQAASRGAIEADALIVWLHAFNSRAARTWLSRLAAANRPVFAAGPLAEWHCREGLVNGGIDRLVRQDADVNVPPLPDAALVNRWPRWDIGLANEDTFGFPLERQPHPWNVPLQPRQDPAAIAQWLASLAPALATLRRPLLWLNARPGTWDREGMDVLGQLSLDVLHSQGTPPAFGARLWPPDVLAPTVAQSLSLMEVDRIELLAWAGNQQSLQRLVPGETLASIWRAAAELERAMLADKTCLRVVIGLPGESSLDAVETVRFALRVAAAHGIGEVRYEWWYNVPGSPLHMPSPEGHGEWLAGRSPLSDDLASAAAPWSGLSIEDRRQVLELLDLLRLVQRRVRLVGPTLAPAAPPREGAVSPAAEVRI